jgi:hypothetical protein
MVSARRVVGVTLGLVGAGALLGAVAGAVAVAVSVLITENDTSGDGLVFGAFFGAPLGAITAPVLAWLMLRTVPLGKMFVVAAAGTAVGGIIGWVTTTSGTDEVVNGLAGAFIGCVVASITLHYRALGRPRA